MGILIQTTSLLYIFPSSLGFAVSTRVGNELGSNRPNTARLSAIVAVTFAGVMDWEGEEMRARKLTCSESVDVVITTQSNGVLTEPLVYVVTIAADH
ncbi:hypothetical protein Bca52824_023032 [Brassica carinata]|uniref:Uncharacterized protein n=1 Tax=Brassica carinata TaxID=52824 RepID=A0A8X7VI85_BRACI|nr:hypothetical protein Bca52824_023032 [Brassica carinata]